MESRVIQLTSAAHKHGNLNIRSCGKDFFPSDAFGGSSVAKGLGNPITVKVEGFSEPIETDIPTDNKTGKPRWIFRKRAWVKEFTKIHNLNMGDTIVVNRVNQREYTITADKTSSDLIKLEEAARIVGKTPHNIRDYIQRGRINKYNEVGERISKANNGELRVSRLQYDYA